jgi:hypothetical protein
MEIGERCYSQNDKNYLAYCAFCALIGVEPAAYSRWIDIERRGVGAARYRSRSTDEQRQHLAAKARKRTMTERLARTTFEDLPCPTYQDSQPADVVAQLRTILRATWPNSCADLSNPGTRDSAPVEHHGTPFERGADPSNDPE